MRAPGGFVAQKQTGSIAESVWWLVVGGPWSVVGCPWPVIPPSTINDQRSAINDQPSTINTQPPTDDGRRPIPFAIRVHLCKSVVTFL